MKEEADRLIRVFWGDKNLKLDRPFTEENYMGAEECLENCIKCVEEKIELSKFYAPNHSPIREDLIKVKQELESRL